MVKSVVGIFVSGIVMVLVGIFLASQGLSSNETGLIISGDAIADALNESVDSEEVAQAVIESKDRFFTFGAIVFILGLLGLIVVSVLLVWKK
jgi:hypothetical protein